MNCSRSSAPGSMSRPSTRIVGEPRKRSRCAVSTSGTSIARSSGATPSSRLMRSTSACAPAVVRAAVEVEDLDERRGRGYFSVFRYVASARSWSGGMIPPQCGMLTIGARPITLPERITSMIFWSVLNWFRKSTPESGGIVLSGRLRVRHAAETVRSVAVDAAVTHVQHASLRPPRPGPVGHHRRIRGRHLGQPGADVRDRGR